MQIIIYPAVDRIGSAWYKSTLNHVTLKDDLYINEIHVCCKPILCNILPVFLEVRHRISGSTRTMGNGPQEALMHM